MSFVRGMVFHDEEGNGGKTNGEGSLAQNIQSSTGSSNDDGSSPSSPPNAGDTSQMSSTESGSSDSAHRRGNINEIYNATSPILDYEACRFALSSVEPSTHHESIVIKEWKAAMEEEIAALERHQTWSLTELPHDKKPIGLKWVLKLNFNADGKIQKHKARIVAKGYAQKSGIDYDYQETFSPVTRFETIRLVLALVAKKGWMAYQFNVKSAFLNGVLKEEVYVMQPPGFEKKGEEHKILILHKALYGFKQAPRAWYSRIDGYLVHIGYKRSQNEPTLYVKWGESGDVIVVYLYVDDIVYARSS
ncbi:putative RNA-directed DNA polymerase [Helianthus annuus]|nr:putative RNA-directed DNA polymerase [Helianthus annuus]